MERSLGPPKQLPTGERHRVAPSLLTRARQLGFTGSVCALVLGVILVLVTLTGILPTPRDDRTAATARSSRPLNDRDGSISERRIDPMATPVLAPSAATPPDPPPTSADRPELPDGAPPAGFAPEPALPHPAGWPFPESFPRTSGTGRLDSGAFFWSDFLYDDHGAIGQGLKWYQGQYRTSGTFSYPPMPGPTPGLGIGGDNAADLFRVAVGLDAEATYWRVDWNTLIDPAHPIAAFGLDTDNNPATGTESWPGITGLRSGGIEAVLTISSRGAWLHQPDGRQQVAAPSQGLTVDSAARSFVVRLDRATLPPSGIWRARVISGVADTSGQAFASIGAELGAAPGQPPVFNVSFRRSDQEMATLREPNGAKIRGLYSDKAQAEALTRGDISPFYADIAWNDLASQVSTPEPLVTGPSNRWYVSTIELGQGVVNTYGGFSDGKPNLLGRVQPYTVWVPEGYNATRPAPLTLLVHPNGSTHNEYIDSPKLMQAACEDPVSICVTPAGRSPDQTPSGEMELDLWEVWKSAAAGFHLDGDRTRLFGFSQGGGVANHIVMTYPDLFARAAVFSPGCCGDIDTVENLRWVPIFLGEPAADPTLAQALPEADRLAVLGYRHRFEVYPDQDHVTFGYKDHYARGALYLGDGSAVRTSAPDRVTYVWSHDHDRPDLGFGVQGAYWIRSPQARDRSRSARVEATSHAQPDPAVTVAVSREPVVTDDPSPAMVTDLTWTLGQRPVRRPHIDLHLSNVAELAVRIRAAGLRVHEAGVVSVTCDGPVVIVLRELTPGTSVVSSSPRAAVARADGTAVVHLDSGSHTLEIRPPTRRVGTDPITTHDEGF